MPCGQAIGRWGNFINVEAYGTETTNFLRMSIFENGIYKEVHPAFLYESIPNFIIFIILMMLQNKDAKNNKKALFFQGKITYIYIILYSFARFFIEGLRTDSLMLGNLRISQILSLILFVVFCIILGKNIKQYKKNM